MTHLGIALILSYLAGSIPTALIVGRIAGKIDIREHGSGNAGATNVYRVLGLKPYIVTLSIDIFKGFAAVAFIAPIGAGYLSEPRTALACGVMAIIGHIWTVFAGFKGGKGVATAGGVMLGVVPYPTLAAIGVYFIVTLTTQYVSLGSMTAAISFPVLLFFLNKETPPELYVIGAAVAALIVFTHRDNIKRLISGEEKRTNFLSKLKKEKSE